MATNVRTLLILSVSERVIFDDGLKQLKNGHFFSAHELFEAAFRSSDQPACITFFRGLAQLAAAYHQLTLGRGRASARTWQRARGKLAQVGALDESFAAAVDALHARLGVNAEGPRFFDPTTLGPLQSFPVPDQMPST